MFANYQHEPNIPSTPGISCNIPLSINFSPKNLNFGHLKTSNTPKTMKNLDNHLAQRTNKEYDPIKRRIVEAFLKEVIDKNELCMACPDNIKIMSSIKKEHFKNIFENRVESIYDYIDHEANKEYKETVKGARKKISKKLFGWKHTPKDEEFEKYGIISNKQELSCNDTTCGYGPIKYIFDKKKVASRTTFVIGDSLDNQDYGVQASRVTNPKIESIPGVVCKNHTGVNKLYEMMEDSHDYILKNPSQLSLALPYKPDRATYIEAQFHGNLTLDDVQSVLVTSNQSVSSVDDIKSALSDTHLSGKVEGI